ncbi:MFS transporter [Tengunoibacter tsumagoiensis]|uniref:MFS transporter n=1 Tax=Tengunoibacter tsumagoiensis TaxID=2014871 RepID=A0A401ZVL0_9CHLR|nr:MFS transporter [Tengunoibacter tsumagoiensis]GCE10958.1 MFS transporter [Tengunoibacter tsumagoiensis]
MFALLSQRNFCLLWVAHTLSILGDYVFFIAITFWVYEQTGSASATAAVLIVSTVPGILFAPLAGVLVDRWERRSIMLAVESARAVLFLALLGTIFVQPHTLWPIYVVGFLQSALATFFWSARGALLPQMIEPPSLLVANALYMVSDGAVRVIAPSLSAFILLNFGPPGVVTIDATTFLISVGSICLLTSIPLQDIEVASSSEDIPRPSQIVDVPAKREQRTQMTGNANHHVRGLLMLGSIVAYTAGTLSILFPVFVRTMLSAGPLAFGWILTAQAIGEGAMSLLLGRIPPRRGRFAGIGIVSGGLAVGGFVLMLIVSIHTLFSSLLLNLIFGAMTAAVTLQLLTLLQQRVANRFLGRTLATYTAAQALAQVGGMGIASATFAHIGLLWLMMFDGALYLLGSGLAWIVLTGHDDSGLRKSEKIHQKYPER